MRNILALVCFCLLFIQNITAQDEIRLGLVTQQEIDMKQCAFDKEARSVILLHEATSDYDEEHHLITVHHIKLKILKESSVSEANISIPFYRKDGFEFIDQVEGMTINPNPDGSLVKEKLDKKAIFTKETNDRVGEVIFAFPSVKAGSIIDYKYRSYMKHYGGLQDWYFQERVPVVLSKYLLGITPNTEFAYRINKNEDRNIVIKPDTHNGRIYFEMSNIPGLDDEPYMDARKDYIQKIIFQLSGYAGNSSFRQKYMTSWDAMNTELLGHDLYGMQLKKNLDAPDVLLQAALLSTPQEKMRFIYNYVRSNMSWNGLYSKLSSDGIKSAWKKRSGTSGDINLILVNLLIEAGLDAAPMLVSERGHGKVNVDYPFIDQFSSTFACVSIGSKKYYLDATDLYCPAHITPNDILNTMAFVVKKKTGGLINIVNDSLQYKENTSVFLSIKDDGTLTGEATVISEDYARTEKTRSYKKNSDQFKKAQFSVEEILLASNKFEIKNLDNDSLALIQEITFSSTLNNSGDYKYIPLNFFSGFKSNPFLSDNRFSTINFGFRKMINLAISIDLPANYAVDNLPKSLKMVTPDKDISFIRQVVHDQANNRISCRMELEFKNSFYPAEDYPVLKEVYKRLFEYLKEPVLLKKK